VFTALNVLIVVLAAALAGYSCLVRKRNRPKEA